MRNLDEEIETAAVAFGEAIDRAERLALEEDQSELQRAREHREACRDHFRALRREKYGFSESADGDRDEIHEVPHDQYDRYLNGTSNQPKH